MKKYIIMFMLAASGWVVGKGKIINQTADPIRVVVTYKGPVCARKAIDISARGEKKLKKTRCNAKDIEVYVEKKGKRAIVLTSIKKKSKKKKIPHIKSVSLKNFTVSGPDGRGKYIYSARKKKASLGSF